jgi:acyl dehydratase
MTDVEARTVELDTSDVDRYVGQPVGGGQLKEPVTVTDIRRWVQAMRYPNPRHFEEEAAAATPFGEIVAPQSFTVCCDVGHGTVAAIVGTIPGSHTIFGGDEWWFYGPRVRPGDRVSVERRFDGYSVADTRFAGPTMFSRGDSTYLNQRREPIAKLRSTMVRYVAENARERGLFESDEAPRSWTAEELADLARQEAAWVRSGASGEGPGEVRIGDALPTRPIGPHTAASFAAEYRSFPASLWGAFRFEGHFHGADAGWLPEFQGDDAEHLDDTMRTGMDRGPASGHTNLDKAKLVGLPRHYGYGTSIGAWSLDSVAYWAGDDALIRHAKLVYRYPVFEGDATFVDGEVTHTRFEPLLGVPLVALHLRLTNQDGELVAEGDVDVQLTSG